MKEKGKILFFCMIIAVNGAFCQQLYNKAAIKPIVKPLFTAYQSIFYEQKLIPVIPGNYYSCNLGFFCKNELKFEAATRIPFKFRLGSLQYNDWLEGKKSAGILPVR